MLYALAVLTRWFCPPKRDTIPKITELNETKPSPPDGPAPSPEPDPSTPKPPPSSPVIAPVATANYPDLPTLNPSLVREDDGTYSV